MKTSARNQFSGLVSNIVEGAINVEVSLDIGGGKTIVAMITPSS